MKKIFKKNNLIYNKIFIIKYLKLKQKKIKKKNKVFIKNIKKI